MFKDHTKNPHTTEVYITISQQNAENTVNWNAFFILLILQSDLQHGLTAKHLQVKDKELTRSEVHGIYCQKEIALHNILLVWERQKFKLSDMDSTKWILLRTIMKLKSHMQKSSVYTVIDPVKRKVIWLLFQMYITVKLYSCTQNIKRQMKVYI